MSPKAILSARPGAFKFSDRVINLEVPCKIGRAFKNDKSESTNGYFDCKVLSKAHALLLYDDNKFVLMDTGSSNGTFVNNIRLSKAGQESGITEVFNGDILRFGSDVVDKAKNATQKCVVLRLKLFGQDGEEWAKRPSQSRLFRPSDSYEDLSIVTNDLRTALGREKLLEDKLISIKSIVIKHKDSADFPGFIDELRGEVENLPGDMQPSKILQEEKRLDRLLKENRALVMRCKEVEMKLDAKEGHCSRLQDKVTKDAGHIHSLGTIIDKLRTDIGSLQTTIETVKGTQERVRDEYEETLMKQRSLFDHEIVELTEGMRAESLAAHRKAEDEKYKLEAQVAQLKDKLEGLSSGGGSTCWSKCSSMSSISPPNTPLIRPDSCATDRSTVSSVSSVKTIIHSLNKIVNHRGEIDFTELKEDLKGEEDAFDLSEDLESSLQLFNGLINSKDEEITRLKLETNELHREIELLRMKENNFAEMQDVATDEAETICRLEKRIFDLSEALVTQKEKVEYEKEKVKRVEGNAKKENELLKILVNELHREIEGKDEHMKEIMTQLTEAKDDIVKLEEANGRLKGQAISKWVDAAEADFDSMFQEEFALLRGSRDPSIRQSSEVHTADSTPFPGDIPAQDAVERVESMDQPSFTQRLPERTSSLLTRVTSNTSSALSRPSAYQWVLPAFIVLLLAITYSLFFNEN